MQDFNPEAGYVEESGMIRFRGNWPDFWCGDAQTGYILKAYREHQTSTNRRSSNAIGSTSARRCNSCWCRTAIKTG